MDSPGYYARKEENMIYDVKASGKRVQELRKKQGMTQMEFAEVVGVSVDTISKIERGARGMSPDLMGIIAEELNSSTDYIGYGRCVIEVSEDMMGIIMEMKKHWIKN